MRSVVLSLFVFALVFSSTGFAAQKALKSPKKIDSKAALYNNEGVESYRGGAYRGAKASFEDAIKVKPDFAEAYYNLALSYRQLGNHSKAARFFKRAMKYGKNNPKIAKSKVLRAYINTGTKQVY